MAALSRQLVPGLRPLALFTLSTSRVAGARGLSYWIQNRPSLQGARQASIGTYSIYRRRNLSTWPANMYPPIEPYETGKLKVSDLHTL